MSVAVIHCILLILVSETSYLQRKIENHLCIIYIHQTKKKMNDILIKQRAFCRNNGCARLQIVSFARCCHPTTSKLCSFFVAVAVFAHTFHIRGLANHLDVKRAQESKHFLYNIVRYHGDNIYLSSHFQSVPLWNYIK